MLRARACLAAALGLAACGGAGSEPDEPEAAGGAAGVPAGTSASSGADRNDGGAGTTSIAGVPAGGSGAAGAPSTAGSGGGAGDGGALGSCESKSNALGPWPGDGEVSTLEPEPQFQANLSGLTYEAGSKALWAVDNIPGTLFRLVPSANGFATDAANGWANGKALRYPNGSSAPDAEGVTFGADASGIYVCAEHDNAAASVSRQSVLRFDVTAAGATLSASHEWNLTSVLPSVGANSGIEAITWVPDAYLTARGFYDEAKQQPYEPAGYGQHGAGLFFVGVEESGKLYAVALDHAESAASLVATISTPNPGVMGLELDRETEQLWFHCDETCNNQSGILDIDTREDSPTRGRFVVVRRFERPTGLPDSNHEGIAIGPESACEAGLKPFFWTDDADVDGFSLRRGYVACGRCP